MAALYAIDSTIGTTLAGQPVALVLVADQLGWHPVLGSREFCDVFFHDTHGAVNELVTAIEEHMGEFRADYPEVPYIIPNVPELMITGSDEPSDYNQAFADYVASDPHAYLLDLDNAFGKVLAGKVTYTNQPLSSMDILVDPVHLNELGQMLVAELMIIRLNEIFPGLGIEPYGNLVIAD